MLVGPNLLLAPCLVSERRDPIGKDFGHPSGATHGCDDRPKRVIARGAQADRFNHRRKLTRLLAKIKRRMRTKNVSGEEKRRRGRGIDRTAQRWSRCRERDIREENKTPERPAP